MKYDVSEYHYGVKTKLHDNSCLEKQLKGDSALAIQLVFENQLQSAWRVVNLKGRPFSIPNELRLQLTDLLAQPQQPTPIEAPVSEETIQQLRINLECIRTLLQSQKEGEFKTILIQQQQEMNNQLLNALLFSTAAAMRSVAVRCYHYLNATCYRY